MRGENVVVNHELLRRIARVEDTKHWLERPSQRSTSGAGAEWQEDMFVLVRFYKVCSSLSSPREAYPHLERFVEVQLEASDKTMVWLPAMHIVGVAFVSWPPKAPVLSTFAW